MIQNLCSQKYSQLIYNTFLIHLQKKGQGSVSQKTYPVLHSLILLLKVNNVANILCSTYLSQITCRNVAFRSHIPLAILQDPSEEDFCLQ